MSKFIFDENIFVTIFTKIKNLIAGKADKDLTNVDSTDFKAAYENSGANGTLIVTTDTTSTGTAYIANNVPGITELYTGLRIILIPSIRSSSTTPTLNINGLGAKQIRRKSGWRSLSSQMVLRDKLLLETGYPIDLMFDGTYWIFQNEIKPSALDLDGTVPITKGGTGETTASAALISLGGVSKTTNEDISGVKIFTNGLKSKKVIEVINPDNSSQYTEITPSDIIFRSDTVSSSSNPDSGVGSIVGDYVAGIGFMDNTTDIPSVFSFDSDYVPLDENDPAPKTLAPLNVGEPISNSNAATKKYVDDNKTEQNIWYGTCSTASGTIAKIATTSTGNFKLVAGKSVIIKFTNYTTASNPTLNVDNTGAKPIKYMGTSSAVSYEWHSGETIILTYDGTNYIIGARGRASTNYYGVTKLNSSVNSTSTSEAATPSAVKQAYDAAISNLYTTEVTTESNTITIPVTLTSTSKLILFQNGILLNPTTNYTHTTTTVTLNGYNAQVGDVFTFIVGGNLAVSAFNANASNITITNTAAWDNATSVEGALNVIHNRIKNNITISVNEPTSADGENGDIWFVY